MLAAAAARVAQAPQLGLNVVLVVLQHLGLAPQALRRDPGFQARTSALMRQLIMAYECTCRP